MKKIMAAALMAVTLFDMSAKRDEPVAPSFAWGLVPPLGFHVEAPIDTLLDNYSLRFVPSAVSNAYATTGNYGAEGETLLFFDRKLPSDFFFADALSAYLPSESTARFYNTRIPMTLLSYSTGGGKEVGQERLSGIFSGNINSRAQIGANLDYLYSKGSYANQAAKHFNWGFSGSYIGERVEFQGFYDMYNSLNKENGGIVDDLYITDPAEIQGGNSSVDFKTIPTRLSAAHNRIIGGELYLNGRYKLGFWRDKESGDTVVKEYVPVTSLIWTLDLQKSRHMFRNDNAQQAREFWPDTYFDLSRTYDVARAMNLRNTFGIALLEGFNKYAKAGAAIYASHEYHRFEQPRYDVADDYDDLTPLPAGAVPQRFTEHQLGVGIQLTKRQGRVINYEANAELGVLGASVGELKADGRLTVRIPMLSDTVGVTAFGCFSNLGAPFFMEKYVSNHFAWNNNFGRERRMRLGGEIALPRTSTKFGVGVENLQNYIYFNDLCLPTQHGGSVQVVSANLRQDFRFGLLSWQNSLTYQTTTDDAVIPLPKLTVYTNLFVNFKVAGVLDVQLGADCSYYTRYMAVDYQPATMSFYNQRLVKCGGYPFMNLYVNMRLSRTRFFLMMSHVNQGLTGDNYFSMPHYPLNPRRFQMGLSVDFAN